MKFRKLKGNQVVLSLVALVLGFLVAFSYSITERESESKGPVITDKQWEQNINLKKQLADQVTKNRELQTELNDKHDLVREFEQELAQEAQVFFNLAEDAEKYRMYLGKVKVKGNGVQVTLKDGEYNPDEKNINNYLVHEHHVFKVINELYISGASAISVNGKRLTHQSYIVCNGPVITVDGSPFPAPFVITALGDPEVLSSALNLTGGVKDQLVNDSIQFSLEEKTGVIMDPILGG